MAFHFRGHLLRHHQRSNTACFCHPLLQNHRRRSTLDGSYLKANTLNFIYFFRDDPANLNASLRDIVLTIRPTLKLRFLHNVLFYMNSSVLIQVFAEPDKEVVREKSQFFSLMFVTIGGVSFVTMFLQV